MAPDVGVPSQRGDTLVEVLIAIAVVTLVGLAAFAGLQTTIRSTVDHRELGQAEAIVRSAAENLQNPETPYIDRAGCDGANYTAFGAVPSGYSVAVTNVGFWSSRAAAPATSISTAFSSSCPAVGSDPGLQRVQLTVTAPAGATAELEVLKRRQNATP